jgi:acetylglutamate kinase
MKPIVLKVSGHELSDHAYLTLFALTIAELKQPTVIVHGGGKEISSLQKTLGIEPRYLDGVRITDKDSLDLVTMVLCGLINKRLVRYLTAVGLEVQGLSGVDRGLVRATKMPHPEVDMGFTGEVAAVRGEILLDLLAQGITPVIAPVCLGEDTEYNVNADYVAGAVASSIDAERLIFLSNVEGVIAEKQLLRSLSPEATEKLIADGTIYGGMIPKVQTALEALSKGVERAVITDLAGLKTHGGTVFTKGATL